MNQAQLLAEKRLGIGGSDWDAITNSQYGCRRAKWYFHRNQPEDFPLEVSPAMARGTAMEPVIRSLTAERLQRAISVVETVQVRGLAHVHIDGLVADDVGLEDEGIFEAKCTGYRTFSKFKKDGLHDSYIMQAQWMLWTTGLGYCVFGVLCPDPWQLAVFRVEADTDMQEMLVAEAEMYWKQVTEGPAPDILPQPDKRCVNCPYRATCLGNQLLGLTPEPTDEGGSVETDLSLDPLIRHWQEAKEIADAAEANLDDCRGELESAIGDRKKLQTGIARITRTAFPVTRWDSKGLTSMCEADKKLAETLAKCRKTSQQSKLTIRLYGDKE